MDHNNLSSPAKYKRRFKKKLDEWLVELDQEYDRSCHKMDTVRMENKTLYQEILESKTSCLKKLSGVMDQREELLDRQFKKSLISFEKENHIFYDKLHQLQIDDRIIQEEHQRLISLQEHLRLLDEKILQQEEAYQKLVKESNSVDGQLKTRRVEKERVLASIKLLGEAELPPQELRLKELVAAVEKVQAQVNSRQSSLGEVTREIVLAQENLRKLEEKKVFLEQKQRATYDEQKNINKTLSRLVSEISQKNKQHEVLYRKLNRLESEVKPLNDTFQKMQSSIRLLNEQKDKSETFYRSLVKETNDVESQIQTIASKKQSTLLTIRHLEKMDLPRERAELKKIEAKVTDQEAVNQKLLKELSVLEEQIVALVSEKQSLLNTIKHLTDDELPQKEVVLKKNLDEARRIQDKIVECQELLVGLKQDISTKSNEVLALQKKRDFVQQEYEETLDRQERLNVTLLQVRKEVDQSISQRDELAKEKSRLESDVSAERGRIVKIREVVASLNDEIIRRQDLRGNLIGEKESLKRQLPEMRAEKQKISTQIEDLKKMKLVPAENKLEEVNNDIVQQKALNDDLRQKIASGKSGIQVKTSSRQAVLDAIQRQEEVALPQQEAHLKELKNEEKKIQSEDHEWQGFLAKIEEAIVAENNKLGDLRQKEIYLKNQQERLESEQNKQRQHLIRLKSEVGDKRQQRQKLSDQADKWRFKIAAQAKVFDRLTEQEKLLASEISGQDDALREITEALLRDQKEFKPLILSQKWKTIFSVCLILLMVFVLGFILWYFLGVMIR